MITVPHRDFFRKPEGDGFTDRSHAVNLPEKKDEYREKKKVREREIEASRSANGVGSGIFVEFPVQKPYRVKGAHDENDQEENE